MITIKIDLLSELKNHGFSTYRIRKEKLFSEVQLQAFRKNVMPSISALDTACQILKCQPGHIIEYIMDTPPDGSDHDQPEKSGTPNQGIRGNSGTKKSTRA